MVDLLDIKADAVILEVGCGTGRDSFRIARRLGEKGVLFLQDLSRNMVVKTRQKLTHDYKEPGLSCELNYFVSNAANLPFPDDYFDALFHFGGFNNFGNPQKTLEEFSRIVKKGGKVVLVTNHCHPGWKILHLGKLFVQTIRFSNIKRRYSVCRKILARLPFVGSWAAVFILSIIV